VRFGYVATRGQVRQCAEDTGASGEVQLRLGRDGQPFVTDGGNYIEGIDVPGALHVVYVTATIAHARIVGIDTTDAVRLPGVVGVFTAADVDLPPDGLPHPRVPAAMARPRLATERRRARGATERRRVRG